MAIQAGLVGLPNVGKSTLFNALTKSSIPAENYPFCTVDPNVAITPVPDARIDKFVAIFKSPKIVPATMKFVDIAGLVKGASQGEGLGNQFLGHIMEVDLILHVLRCFEDDNILHVHNKISPLDDFEIICAELMLKDLETVARREEKIVSLGKKQMDAQQQKELELEKDFLEKIKKALNSGTIDSLKQIQELVLQAKAQGVQVCSLLSSKNYLIIANIPEDDCTGHNYENNERYKQLVSYFGKSRVIPISAKIESELAQMDDASAQEMLMSLGIEHKGLDEIIMRAYENLGLITFFTVGPKETHAWGLKKNTCVLRAAGEIHSDLERGFICAEVYNCEDLFAVGSETVLRTQGKIRTEGKDYIVRDGDVLHIRFNV
jgi:GTP-binding protein YchF